MSETTTQISEYTVTEGETSLTVRNNGEWWVVGYSTHAAPFASLEEAMAAAEKWVKPLERARTMRLAAQSIERAAVAEIAGTPFPR